MSKDKNFLYKSGGLLQFGGRFAVFNSVVDIVYAK